MQWIREYEPHTSMHSQLNYETNSRDYVSLGAFPGERLSFDYEVPIPLNGML